jgi:PilZ domain
MAEQRNRLTRREGRKNFRIEWHTPTSIYYSQKVRACILGDLSNGGAKITGVRAATIPDEFMMRVTPHGRNRKCRVVWRTDDALGVQFTDSNTTPATQTAGLIVANAEPEPTG